MSTSSAPPPSTVSRPKDARTKSPLNRMRRGLLSVAVLSLGLTAFADWLFWDAPMGWTAGLFTAALVAAIWWRGLGGRSPIAVILLGVAVLGIAVAMVQQPGWLEIAVGAVGLMTLAATARAGWTDRMGAWAGRYFSLAVTGWGRLPLDAERMRQIGGRRGETGFGLGRRTLAWGVPIVLTAVFVGLFAMANPIVERWIGDAGAWLRNSLNRLPPGGRVLLWMLVLLGVWGLLRTRPRMGGTGAGSDGEHSQSTGPADEGFLARVTPTGLVVRSLVLFNIAFAVQTGLDAAYLWGGATLPEGMSYAEYAHRGAYPLLAATLLAGVFVLVAFRPGGEAERSRWARWLVYLWLVQNVILVGSSALRLGLYIEVYALTRWRVAAAIWMGVVAIGLLLVLWRIVTQRSNAWLTRMNVIVAVAVVYASCFVNFDGRIAWFNARHCREVTGRGVKLDVDYLTQLGPDTIPALLWVKERANDAELIHKTEQSLSNLSRRLAEQTSGWRGWTWRRARLQEFVEQHMDHGTPGEIVERDEGE